MSLLRIQDVVALEGLRLRLTLTDGSVVERDVSHLVCGSIFDTVRDDPKLFARARADAGTVVWPNGADLCPDVLIWGGMPPEDESDRPAAVEPEQPAPARG